MTISPRFCRFSLFACAAIFSAIALVIATAVIPPVKADVFPLATPEAAATAFWASVVLYILLATALFLSTPRATNGSGNRTGLLISLAVLALLGAFALGDAASAFQSHGHELQTATTYMVICTTAAFLASALLITIALILRRLARIKQ